MLNSRFQDTINIMFLGHLHDKDLVAGVGIGTTMINLMGLTVIKGVNMALDTLVS